MTARTITVSGMSCGHCVDAVQAELGKLAGVERVEVDLASGLVTIESDTALLDEVLAAAIDEAGYEVVVS